jgi:MFS family permease
MLLSYFIINPLKRFFTREDNQFYISMFIRSFALGMILIFEPIYLYLHFQESLPLTLVFFALIHGIYGLLTVIGGKIMARLGYDWAILISHLFFLGYYILLYMIDFSSFVVPIAIVFKALGMTFFWPSYHTSFARFSKKDQTGKYVSRKFYAYTIPNILGPIIGGIILSKYDYSLLFVFVLVFLLISAIPLFFKREKKESFTDGCKEAWGRVFRKENKKYSIGFICESLEGGTNIYLWPLFMFILGIQYLSMGGITSFAVFFSLLTIFYAGRISDSFKRLNLLNIGSFLTSAFWALKLFVYNPISAFFIHNFYMMSRYLALVPFHALFYEKAASQESFTDEFIILREIVSNFSRFIFLLTLAGILCFFRDIRISFVLAAIISFGFMTLGKPPKFQRIKTKSRYTN